MGVDRQKNSAAFGTIANSFVWLGWSKNCSHHHNISGVNSINLSTYNLSLTVTGFKVNPDKSYKSTCSKLKLVKMSAVTTIVFHMHAQVSVNW